MSTYIGDPRTHQVTKDGVPLQVHQPALNLSKQFDWGITGPSTTQLALAILMSVHGNMNQAVLLAKEFAIVALVRDIEHGKPFTLTTEQINAYIAEAHALKGEIHYR